MLVFHTVLPLKSSVTRKQCVDLFIKWVSDNYRQPFNSNDFSTYDRDGHEDFCLAKDNFTYAISHYKDENIELTACRLREEGREIWETTNIYVNQNGNIRLYIQTEYITGSFGGIMPPMRPPFTIKLFVRAGLCDTDALFEITDKPIVLTEDLVEPCGLAMQAAWDNIMPIVYCSKDYWPTNFPVNELAKKLQGVAHIVVEPSMEISYKLREASSAKNVFRGHIGIYLPNETYHRKFSVDYTSTHEVELFDDIIATIRNAWLNSPDTSLYTWDYIQSLKSKQRVYKLEQRTTDLNEIKELNSEYEAENYRLTNQLAELRKEKTQLYEENERLRSILSSYRSAGGQSESYLIRTGEEYDLYPGEQTDLIIEILQKSLKSYASDSRPYTLITSILDVNTLTGHKKEIKGAIENVFNGSGSIRSERDINTLKGVGFEVEKGKTHYKITFAGDSRYLFTVSSSGSDTGSGGENMINEIERKLFSK